MLSLEAHQRDLMSGIATFLFTNIAGPTGMLQQLGADRNRLELADQRRIHARNMNQRYYCSACLNNMVS